MASPAYPAIKRAIDTVSAAVLLVVASPVLVPIAIVLRCTGEGEVFYRQERIGRDERPFGIWKFATMLKDSPNLGTGTLTVADDPRVTRVGRLLRATKINEVPQLINVLVGDMSFVGPRPQVQRDVEARTADARGLVGALTPGITGIGSVVFRDEQRLLSRAGIDPRSFYVERIMPYKSALELWYVRNRSLWTDARIVAVTAWAVLSPNSQLVFRVFPDLPPRPAWFDED